MRTSNLKKKIFSITNLYKHKNMATIIIPTPLRKFTNNSARLEVKSNTVEESIKELSLNFPDLKKHLLDDSGKLRSFVNIFVGDNDIRDLDNVQTKLSNDTVVSIVPAIAGGNFENKDSSKASPPERFGGAFSKEELARYNRHIII